MLETLIKGSWMMIPLLVCSILTAAVVLDRFLVFYRYRKLNTEALRSRVMSLVRDGNLYEAATFCQSTPGPVSAVMLTGLQSFVKYSGLEEPPEMVRASTEKSMEDYSYHALSAVGKRLNVLATVGNAAPLFGMAGTVTGMISAFAELQMAAGLDPGAVAGGISEALVTTAAGLLIALAAVIPYNIFTAETEKIELEVDEASSELLEYLTVHPKTHGEAA